MLSDHRIHSIESYVLHDRLPRLVGPGAQGQPSGYGGSRVARVITTDQGATGWGIGVLGEAERRQFLDGKLSDLFDPDLDFPDTREVRLAFL